MSSIGRRRRGLAAGRHGFTLPELLIAMALVALLMTAAALAIQAAQTSRSYNEEKSDLLARSRGTLDRIARDVRLAVSVEIPDDRTVAIAMPNGDIHTYQWDGVEGGNLTYTLTEDLTITSAVLTDHVRSFVVSDASPACQVAISLAGPLATSEASLTATPRKAVY